MPGDDDAFMCRIALARSAGDRSASSIVRSESDTKRDTESRSFRCLVSSGGEPLPAGLSTSPISEPQCSKNRSEISCGLVETLPSGVTTSSIEIRRRLVSSGRKKCFVDRSAFAAWKSNAVSWFTWLVRVTVSCSCAWLRQRARGRLRSTTRDAARLLGRARHGRLQLLVFPAVGASSGILTVRS